MALRLAGEEYSLVQGLDAQGWLERISVNKSTPALLVEQASSGYILHLKAGGSSILYADSNEIKAYRQLNMGGYPIKSIDELQGYTASHLTLKPGGTAKSVLAKALAGQTAEILAIQDAAGNILAGVRVSGRIVVASGTGEEFQTQNAGKGIIVRTPDGTKDYRIRVDNAGAVATDLIA